MTGRYCATVAWARKRLGARLSRGPHDARFACEGGGRALPRNRSKSEAAGAIPGKTAGATAYRPSDFPAIRLAMRDQNAATNAMRKRLDRAGSYE